MAIYVNRQNNTTSYVQQQTDEFDKYLGTSYILTHKADFEPGRTSDFILKIKFERDLYDMEGQFVATADDATEQLALSLRNYAGPQMSVDTLNIRTGNGIVNYAGAPTVANSAITFTDYIGMNTEAILLAWYSMAHNILNDKIGFKEYYSNDGLLYKWAPNGTRTLSWWLLGCWINEYNQGQFDRQNPDIRTFSTTIIYDKPVPYAKINLNSWKVNTDNRSSNSTDTEYTNYTKVNYIGTQNNTLSR